MGICTRADVTGLVKVLYVDEHYMVYYECVGEREDEYHVCARDAEYMQVASRRRGINAHDRNMLRDVMASKTCIDPSTFVDTSQHRTYAQQAFTAIYGDFMFENHSAAAL